MRFFLRELLDGGRLCAVTGIPGRGRAVARGCVSRMSLRNPFGLKSASPLAPAAGRRHTHRHTRDALFRPASAEIHVPPSRCACVRGGRSVSCSSMILKSRPLSGTESAAHPLPANRPASRAGCVDLLWLRPAERLMWHIPLRGINEEENLTP